MLIAVVVGVAASGLNAQEPQYAFSEQASEQAYPGNEPLVRTMQPLSAEQLEQLVAPIALYPDALVAQILAGSTYPQQISEADRWMQELAGASPDQVAANTDTQPWDPSVKALTAFPRVLAQMDRNREWTTELGNAYYNQPEDVLEAVQVMRRRAQDAGNLQSTPQEIVRYSGDYIALAAPTPQVVYVPAYNPWAVYGEPVAPYPGYTALDAVGDIVGGALQYGLGIATAAFTNAPWGWLAWGLDWLTHAVQFDHSDYSCHSNTVADWGFRHTGFHAYAGRGGYGRNGFGHGGMRGEAWRHGGGQGWHHGGYNRAGWNSFARGNKFEGNRGAGWNSFSRGNSFARNSRGSWNSVARGNNFAGSLRERPDRFQSFGGFRNENGAYGRGFGSRIQSDRRTYAANFSRAGNRGFRASEFGNWSGGRSSESQFRTVASSHGSWGGGGSSHRQSWFGGGGHSQKSFGGRGWAGSHGGGGHAPKSFGGGRGFGGGHSRGGGHSGGHGGRGGRHRR